MNKFFEKIGYLLFGEKTINSKEESENKVIESINQQIIIKKYYNQLTITFKNGTHLSWFIEWEDDYSGEEEEEVGNIIKPWQDFYDWFFNENTETFLKTYNKGCTLIKRSEILSFNIHISRK